MPDLPGDGVVFEFLRTQRPAADGVDGSSIVFAQEFVGKIGDRPIEDDVMLFAHGALFEGRQRTDFDQFPGAIDFQA